LNILDLKKEIAPSILSADFLKLKYEIDEIQNTSVKILHLDVMDGHFVPNITFGPSLVKSIRKSTNLLLDCHLMVSEPNDWVEPFAKAGANHLTVHVECESVNTQTLLKIKNQGCTAGLSLNPNTPVSAIAPYLEDVDVVLLMSVFPGFGGQSFIEDSFDRLVELVKLRGERKFLMQIDGGVGKANIGKLSRLGCDLFVAGSSVFNSSNRGIAIEELRKLL